MIRAIQRWFWARQRAADLRILWPVCKDKAPTLDTAREVFMLHCLWSPCWVREYEDRLFEVVSKLE